MVVTTYGCVKNNASGSAFLYNVNNKRLGLLWFLTRQPKTFNTVAQDVYCLHYIKSASVGVRILLERLGLPVLNVLGYCVRNHR